MQPRGSERRSLREDREHPDVLLALRCGIRERSHLEHVLVLGEHLLDLPGRDVLAAPADRILLTPVEVVHAVLVDGAEVAAVEPEVAECLECRLGLVQVALHDHPGAKRAHQDLTDLPGGELVALVVGDANVPVLTETAHRVIRKHVLRKCIDRQRRLGHPVGCHYADVEPLFECMIGRPLDTCSEGDAPDRAAWARRP